MTPRNAALWSLLFGAMASLAGHAAAQTTAGRVPGMDQARVHDPFSPRYAPMQPNHNPSVSNFTFYSGPVSYGAPWIYTPWYDPWYGSVGPLYPPAILPAEPIYGGAPSQPVLRPENPILDAEPAGPARLKVSNVESRARAMKFIELGDSHFSNQKFRPAIDRYRSAALAAPDLADPFLRQGFAYVALGQYELAAKSFRRALKIQPQWNRSELRLDKLYGQSQIAKNAHLESLAQAVNANPEEGDLWMLLGLELFFDGQTGRSVAFIRKATALGANDDGLLSTFLKKPAPQVARDPLGQEL